MTDVKNEHLVWAYGEMDGGGQALIIGVTDVGLEYLRAGEGTEKKTLLVNPPGRGFANVRQVVVFHEKDKETLKRRLRETGIEVSEAH